MNPPPSRVDILEASSVLTRILGALPDQSSSPSLDREAYIRGAIAALAIVGEGSAK